MHHITIQPGLSDRDRATLIGWTNRKGADFLRQWAGPTPHFPLTPEQFDDWSGLYAIFRQGQFVGIIQEIRREQDNVHIGRFVLDPALTGRGIGRAALLIFMESSSATMPFDPSPSTCSTITSRLESSTSGSDLKFSEPSSRRRRNTR